MEIKLNEDGDGYSDKQVARALEASVGKNDQSMFSQCREIALKLAEELGNSTLPQE